MRVLFLLFFLCFFSSSAFSQTIEGPTRVCQEQCYTYRIPSLGPNAIVEVTDPNSMPAPFTFSPDSSLIEVCFSESGTYTIIFNSSGPGSGGETLEVISGGFTDPILEIEGTPGCPSQWIVDQNCVSVCYGQELTILVRDVAFDTLEWSVFGPADVVSSTNGSITLRLDSVTGNVFISYFGTAGDRCLTEGGKCINLIAPPEAIIGSREFGIISDTLEVCQGQRVEFESESTAPVISWGLSSLASGDGESLSYRFTEAGEYELNLTVGFDCSCPANSSIVIEVNPTPVPEIQCVSSVCAGDTALYETQAGCAPYTWNIQGSGTIITGGGVDDDFVEVIWNGGTTGQVELEHACADACPLPAVEKIDILGPDTEILGRVDICPNQLYTYRVPTRDGSQFSWSVNGGQIQGASNGATARVIFNAFTSDPYIAVEINDCTRGCVRRDTLRVNRVEPFEIEGPQVLCFAEEGNFQAVSDGNPVSTRWTLFGANGESLDSPAVASSDYTFSFSQAGSYRLVAEPEMDIYCSSFRELMIRVLPEISTPGGVNGSDTICPGNLYRYTGEVPVPPGTTREWIIIQDGDSTYKSGSDISQVWLPNVDKQLVTFFRDVETGCVSEVFILPIGEQGDISIEGPDTLCAGLDAIFSIRESVSEEVDWSISGSPGARITESMGLDSVKVLFSRAGSIDLRAEICGQIATRTVFVAAPPPIDESALTAEGCGEDFVRRQVDGTLYDSIFWYENGGLMSTQEAVELRRGQRNMLVVQDFKGCQSRAAFTIPFADFDRPGIRSLGSPVFCNGGQSTLVHDIADTSGLEINWYRDTVPVATNVDSIVVTETGIYRLEVLIIATGCVLESGTLLICESCDPNPDSTVVVCPLIGGGGGMNVSCDPSLGNLNIDEDFINGQCDHIQLIASAANQIEGSAIWRVELSTGVQIFSGDTISFVADQSGPVSVYSTALGVNAMGDTTYFCPEPLEVEVPGTISAQSTLACLGDTTRFFPNIDLISSVSVTAVDWRFGDSPSEGTSSDIMPNYVYGELGTYGARLEIATSASCTLSDSIPLTVFPAPDASWVGDSVTCTDNTYEVEAIRDSLFYEWRFGNPLPDSVQSISRATAYRFNSAGLYDIQLSVEDLLGCRADSIQSFQFQSYSGADSIAIQPGLPACEGNPVGLSVVGPFSRLLWSTGSSAAQITADRPGRYQVLVSDVNGCEDRLGPVNIEYEEAPDAQIRAIPLFGSGRYQGDTLEICSGQSVELRLLTESGGNLINWSTGDNTPVIRYDGEEYSILGEGLYQWNISVTDTTTNCSTSDVFYVRVYSQPATPVITTDAPLPNCAGDVIELEVELPQADETYSWSTGEQGETIMASQAQAYTVRATNAFGCEAESGNFFIHPRPDVSFFPLGCYRECGQAEICLPISTDSRLVEWVRNGQTIPNPSNLPQVLVDSSGTYAAVIENSFGCQQETDSIRFDIFYDAGEVSGFVFLDRNADGVFDAADSLLSDLSIQLLDNGAVEDISTTDSLGRYIFEEVPFGRYEVALDSSMFPSNWNIVFGADSLEVSDCGQVIVIPAFILEECPSVIDSVDLNTCSGDSIEVEGVFYFTDTLFEIVDTVGECTEISVYELEFFPGGDTTNIDRMGCVGDTLQVLGNTYFTDTLIFQTLSNAFGCDSTVAFNLTFESEFEVDSLIQLCPGDSVWVNGSWFMRDTSFSFLGQLPGIDCDVRFFVDVIVQPDWLVSSDLEPSCSSSATGQLQLSPTNRMLGALTQVAVGGVDSLQLNWMGLSAGTYEINLVDTLGCTYQDTVEIGSRPPIEIIIPEVQIPCAGGPVDLRAQYAAGDSSNLTLLWEGGVMGPTLTVSEPGTYNLQVTTDCEDFEVVGRATLESDAEAFEFFVPNVFSPNQDGLNDEFMPSFSDPGAISAFQLQIFDRWGKLLFESRDPMEGWDGYVEDRLMGTGVYVWRMEWRAASCAASAFYEESGSVTIVR